MNLYILGACRAYLGRAQRDDACMHMIAIVGKKEEDIKRQYNKCIGMRYNMMWFVK